MSWLMLQLGKADTAHLGTWYSFLSVGSFTKGSVCSLTSNRFAGQECCFDTHLGSYLKLSTLEFVLRNTNFAAGG